MLSRDRSASGKSGMSLRPRTQSFSPRIRTPTDGGTATTSQRHRTASPYVPAARLLPPLQPIAAPPSTPGRLLSSTISGHVVQSEPPAPSKHVRVYDATTFKEAFGTSMGIGKGDDKVLPAEYENSIPHGILVEVADCARRPVAVSHLDPRVREGMRKWPDKTARLGYWHARTVAKKHSFDRIIGEKRARAGWDRAARHRASLDKLQNRVRQQNKALRRFAAAESAKLTMEWGAPPSPVKVVQPSPSKRQPSLERVKRQLALAKARADASERALRLLVPDTFARLR